MLLHVNFLWIWIHLSITNLKYALPLLISCTQNQWMKIDYWKASWNSISISNICKTCLLMKFWKMNVKNADFSIWHVERIFQNATLIELCNWFWDLSLQNISTLHFSIMHGHHVWHAEKNKCEFPLHRSSISNSEVWNQTCKALFSLINFGRFLIFILRLRNLFHV